MNNIYMFLFYFVVLFLLMAIYFKVAKRLNIIDKPNDRSSHTLVTVRGGGILFPVSAIIFSVCFDFPYPYFMAGLIVIALISFIDDIHDLSWTIRVIAQFLATALIFYELGLFLAMPVYLSLPAAVFMVAMINAWNFMDGINGITGGYSLLTLITLMYLNDQVISFSSTDFMIAVSLSLVVFIFYNFRTHARCFAGDVGSISIAFILAFLMLQLIKASGNMNYILLLLIYGLDSFTTIIFRIIRRERILQPHRSHLYQFLANEKGLSHNSVSLIYIAVQLLVNVIAIHFLPAGYLSLTLFLLGFTAVFIGLRFQLEGSKRLLST